MSEIRVSDLCPHCHRDTVVWIENDDGVLRFRSCEHCDKTLGDLPWKEKTWVIARELKPK